MTAMPALGETVKPPEAVASRDEIQNALHWLARMTRSFASGSDGAILFFDPGTPRFLTPELAPSTSLELRLPDVVLQFLENGAPSPHAMDVDDKSSTEIEAWLLIEMLHRAFDRERFSKALPYPLEHVLSGDARKYAPSTHPEELRAHADKLIEASKILFAVRSAGSPPADDTGHLLCWPERMEIGFVARGLDGAPDLDVGFRLADKDTPSSFFVRPHSSSASDPAERTLVADEGGAGAVERLSSLIEEARTASAH